MPDYRVEWTIDVEAATPREAAESALRIQRDSGSYATVFDVFDEIGETVRVDLDDLGEDPLQARLSDEIDSGLTDTPDSP